MNKYTKINNGICLDCSGKMESYGEHYHIGYECKSCGIKWKFNDDMGPGSYSPTFVIGGRMWRENKLYEIICDLEFVVATYDDNHKIHKIISLLEAELNEVRLNKEKDRE